MNARLTGLNGSPGRGQGLAGLPSGSGEPPVIPYLAGQYAHYIAFTLQMWRQGFRKNSPDAMGVIANKLDDQEIATVAAYYQQEQSTIEMVESQGKD